MEIWLFSPFPWLPVLEKTFKTTELQTWLPNFIEQSFRNKMIDKTFFWNNENYIAKDEIKNNTIKKVKKAVTTFEVLTR